jgi:hypothetical protein
MVYRRGRERLTTNGCGKNVIASFDVSLSRSFVMSHAYLSVLRLLLVYQAHTNRNTARLLGRQKITHCPRSAPEVILSFADTERTLSVEVEELHGCSSDLTLCESLQCESMR